MKVIWHKPIVTVMDVKTGFLESYTSGQEFWKHIWKFPPESKLVLTFGHKFFHWCNVNNKRVWVKCACGLDIGDFNSWRLLKGEITNYKVDGVEDKKILVIRIVNGR